MTNIAYNISDLKLNYLLDKEKTPALRGVHLDVKEGEFVCLSGPSGSGKTTLLNVMGLIESGWDGQIDFFGQSLRGLSDEKATKIRLFDLGFVFQSFFLFPTLTAAENVEYFLIRQKVSAKERAIRVRESLESVGLASFANKRPQVMSGGQRQRVSIARALAKNPKVLIADEPTASLDSQTARDVMDIFKRLNRERKLTCVIASHDRLVMDLAERNIRIRDGLVVEGANL